MNKDIEFIRAIKPVFKSEMYDKISSREKLIAYTMYFLEKNNIPMLFNYICIATYKLFPDRFYFGDFKEFPHIEMLNRTILHLRPKERNYATGSVRSNYKLTELGYQIALEVEEELSGKKNINKSKITAIDSVKKTSDSELKKIIQNKLFKNWEDTGKISEFDIWNYFEVTPYSRTGFIKNQIDELKMTAKKIKSDKKIITFLNELESTFKILI